MKSSSYSLGCFVVSGVTIFGAGGIFASLHNYSPELLALALILAGALHGLFLLIASKNMPGENHFMSFLTKNKIYSVINNVFLVAFLTVLVAYLFYYQESLFQPPLAVLILTYLALMVSTESTRKAPIEQDGKF